MENHKTSRKYGGENEMSWIQPTCLCGWEGKKHFAWNNYQRTNVKAEISKHMRTVNDADLCGRLAKGDPDSV